MMEFRYPKIDAPTESGKIEQMKSYLHQLVDQLQILSLEIDKISNAENKKQGG